MGPVIRMVQTAQNNGLRLDKLSPGRRAVPNVNSEKFVNFDTFQSFPSQLCPHQWDDHILIAIIPFPTRMKKPFISLRYTLTKEDRRGCNILRNYAELLSEE